MSVVIVARDGARADVTVRHAGKRNAMSEVVQDALAATFTELAGDPSIGLVVLTAEGDAAFCSGGDLYEVARADTPELARALAMRIRGVLDTIRRFPAPVVAALNGLALGGGSEFALSADFRVAAAHAHIVFGQVGQAVSPGWGGGADLVELVGAATAQRLLASGTKLTHAEGLSLGLYDAVAAEGEPLAAAVDRFVAALLDAPPQVLRANKSLAIAARFTAQRAAVEAAELAGFVDTWMHPDHWHRLNQFLNRPR
ncbi:MAG TPA: enoyl-CoA hydratase/isomerase family protein [Ilumatobacter sp.]|nr:enoyl-CoA hydratase/isomerase family protein [Ilumatobacter sp.]